MTRDKRKTNWPALLVLLALTGAVVMVAIRYEPNVTAQNPPSVVEAVVIGQTRVTIPTWQLFTVGNIWQLVSANRKLDTNYMPTLVDAPVAHANGDYKVSLSITSYLKQLVDDASKDGVQLMLSSAYRSATDQQAIYDEYLNMRGQQYVHDYVAIPGASEHQTGLAVDISTVSPSCLASGDSCSLDAPSIAWLRANAADYGFIERYPEGKQSITGIAGEHWHYRYVGIPLAKALSSSGVTLDEFVKQVAPGYAN